MRNFKLLLSFMLLLTVVLVISGCNLISLLPTQPYESDPQESATDVFQEVSVDETKYYTVTFNLNGGELVSGDIIQIVEEGASATAPEAKNGRLALSWDVDFSSVTSDLTVNAVWEKVALSDTELAALGQKATVTVNIKGFTGGSGAGSGFFVDDKGTIITAYHVIDGAVDIRVETSDGGTYPIEKVIAFNPLYDIAIIKIDYASEDYLTLAETEPLTGESVVSVGSSLGTLVGSVNFGKVSNTKRIVGKIECIQSTASISGGNSGGPLLNVYGEVVGINCFSYVNADNSYLAVKVAMLDNIGEEKNFSMSEMKYWYATETSRSYSPYDGDGNFYYSLVNNYDTVTGVKCIKCVDEDGKVYSGYHDMMQMYMYNYSDSSYDKYVEYLLSQGFEFEEQIPEGTDVYYYICINSFKGYEIILRVDQSDEKLYISMSKY